MKLSPKQMRERGVNFLYYRKVAEDGQLSPVGGATIAFMEREPGVFIVETAMCVDDAVRNRKDNFNRKVGAMIAGGRLLFSSNARVFESKEKVLEFCNALTQNLGYVRQPGKKKKRRA